MPERYYISPKVWDRTCSHCRRPAIAHRCSDDDRVCGRCVEALELVTETQASRREGRKPLAGERF